MEAKFDARAVFIDHAELWEGPCLRNLAGVTGQVEYDEKDQAVYGVIKLYNEACPHSRDCWMSCSPKARALQTLA